MKPFLFPPLMEEPGLPGNPILHLFFFGYHRGVAETIDVRFWHRFHILAEPIITPLENDIGFPPFIRGSSIVGDLLFNSKAGLRLRTPPDERFSRHRKLIPNDWKNLTISQASKIARDYIRACKSPVGRKIDRNICFSIGGHIHVAKITPSEGFQWIVRPVKGKRKTAYVQGEE